MPLAALSAQPDQAGPVAVDLPSPDLDPADWARLCAALPRVAMIRVRLRHFGDVRALDLARAIRAQGYDGRLRAHGAVLAQAYTLTRRAGFDEVALDRDQARRQPPEHWHNNPFWRPRSRQVAR